MAAERIFDAYISYSREDSEVVKELAQRLKDDEKLDVWLDKWNLVPGEKWQKSAADALNHAQTIVVCIGPNPHKGWFEEEIQRALERQTKDPSIRVIPVLLPNSSEQNADYFFLKNNTWIDFRNGISDMLFYVLVCGIRGVAPGPNPKEIAHKGDMKKELVIDILEDLKDFRSMGLIGEKVHEEETREVIDNYIIYKIAKAA